MVACIGLVVRRRLLVDVICFKLGPRSGQDKPRWPKSRRDEHEVAEDSEDELQDGVQDPQDALSERFWSDF